ncbi:MAG: methyltransferase domain-containing protein [Clostridiales bacterium]|nr:methyltransferase domain-containing protein [Clostridiales bacterium]
MTKIINEWDNVSNQWIDSLEGNHYRNDILVPETLKMLGEIKDKKVIDIGCGEGGYSRLLAEKGADVVGVDFSKELINEAIKHNTIHSIQYYVKDACNLEGIENSTFDSAVSAMCLMAVEDLESAINEAYRVLKPNGRFVLSILHPCFSYKNYFDEVGYNESLSEHLGKPITFWHKTLSKTINLMIKAGFKLELLCEPVLNNNNSNAGIENGIKLKTPMFLLISLIK